MEENKNTPNDAQGSPEDDETREGDRLSPKDESEEQIPRPLSDPIPSTPNLKPSTEMEVHHHGHVHEKQKWKEYVFQFIMLFLAVFCGFLAEYQLEHLIEHNREKQFMRSLITDLRDDQTMISGRLKWYEERNPKMDSLIRLLNSSNIKQHTSDVYYLGRLASRGGILPYNNRTIDQMKNSGGFRLVRKENIANMIMEYYGALSEVKMLEQIDLSEQNEYRSIAVRVFSGEVMQSIINKENTVLRPQGNPPLRTYDKTILADLAGWVHYMNNTRTSVYTELKEIRDQGLKLIDLIKKEYHLE